MCFSPDPDELRARARTDLRSGLPIVLTDGASTVLAAAAESVTDERLGGLTRAGRAALAITDWRARTLKIPVYDGDLARIGMPDGARRDWVVGVADPSRDLDMPMKGPFFAVRGGDPTFARAAIRLAKEARLLPATVIAPVTRTPEGLTVLGTTAPDDAELSEVVSARLPLAVSEAGHLHVFRPGDGGEEHYAVEIGKPDRGQPVLARLHSACLTGDLLGSLKCDCGPQLRGALDRMGAEGSGVLLYLNQEGRGIGLANKMRAYALQDRGFDTVEANHRLGFEGDERDFRIGTGLLKSLGFSKVRLLTNNPAKVRMMENQGIDVVERVPLKAGRSAFNEGYLATKAAKFGHLL